MVGTFLALLDCVIRGHGVRICPFWSVLWYYLIIRKIDLLPCFFSLSIIKMQGLWKMLSWKSHGTYLSVLRGNPGYCSGTHM